LTFTKDIDLSPEAAARHDERHRARHEAMRALFWGALPHPVAQGGAEAVWEAAELTPTESMCWGIWPRFELGGFIGPHKLSLGVAWESGRPDGARTVSGLLVRGWLDLSGAHPIKAQVVTERRDLDRAGAWAIDATQWADSPRLFRPGEMQVPRGPREVLPGGHVLALGEQAGLNRPSSQPSRDSVGFYLALAAAIGHDTRIVLQHLGVLTALDAKLTLTKKAPPAPKAKKP
jgi:hypothetical protein